MWILLYICDILRSPSPHLQIRAKSDNNTWPRVGPVLLEHADSQPQVARHSCLPGSLTDKHNNIFFAYLLDICLKTCAAFRMQHTLWAQVLEEFITISFPHVGIKPHTHTEAETQSESDGDSNEGLGLRCRWCGVTSSHRNMHRIRFTPTESPSTSTSHLFLFHKTSREDDTSERACISPLSLFSSLFLSCTKKPRGERRRRDLRLLTYSDGVSSPHQSRMAANPLLCFCRKKEKEERREMEGGGGVKRCDGVYLHLGGKL